MESFEDRFRREYPDCRCEEERISAHLSRYKVKIGNIECGESGIRDLAFKYAWQDVRDGNLSIPPRIVQLALW